MGYNMGYKPTYEVSLTFQVGFRMLGLGLGQGYHSDSPPYGDALRSPSF